MIHISHSNINFLFMVINNEMFQILNVVARSPVFGHLNSSIQGLTTIRAFQVQSLLVNEFDHHQVSFQTYWIDYIFICYN